VNTPIEKALTSAAGQVKQIATIPPLKFQERSVRRSPIDLLGEPGRDPGPSALVASPTLD